MYFETIRKVKNNQAVISTRPIEAEITEVVKNDYKFLIYRNQFGAYQATEATTGFKFPSHRITTNQSDKKEFIYGFNRAMDNIPAETFEDEINRARKILATAVPKSDSKPLSAMYLYEIARVIKNDWKNVYFGAVPYLDAMQQLKEITDMYGMDSAWSVVAYFLSNARTWKGETARIVKKELNKRLKK